MRRTAPLLILGTLLIVVAGSFSVLTSFVVDWLWFDSLGFGAVFFTVWRTRIVVFAIAAALTSYRVKPDELRLESPDIAQKISSTRYGSRLVEASGRRRGRRLLRPSTFVHRPLRPWTFARRRRSGRA